MKLMTTGSKKLDCMNPLESRPRNGLVAIDLFAGAGGFSLGAFRAGFQVAAALEFETKACDTYRKNLIERLQQPTRLVAKDILEVAPEDFRKSARISSGECDLLLGGPPCQGFSQHRLNGAGENDPRNRLLLRYFEYVEEIRPKFFLVENVPGMLRQSHAEFLTEFYRSARRANYELLDPIILNARDFGVPQNRKRVFIVGRDLKIDVSFPPWPPEKTHGKLDEKYADQSRVKPWVSCGSVFTDAVSPNDPNNLHMQHTPELIEVFKSTPANGGSRSESSRVLPCHKKHDGHKDVYGRIDPSKPGPTMTTACINPSKGRFVHPTEHHGITVRQAARIQSFPDWFEFSGGLMASGAQVGNAVPVLLASVLCTHIATQLPKKVSQDLTLDVA
jgi:DNA (cytosine-5)-methyltransferase 1